VLLHKIKTGKQAKGMGRVGKDGSKTGAEVNSTPERSGEKPGKKNSNNAGRQLGGLRNHI